MTGRFVRVAALVVGGVTLAAGLWAFLSPSSFFDSVALFPPYNAHFLRDVGAFQVGLGATLLLALRWADALFVALTGVGSGAVLHAAAHVIDRDLGGRATDPYAVALVAVVLVVAAVLRATERRRA